MEIYFW